VPKRINIKMAKIIRSMSVSNLRWCIFWRSTICARLPLRWRSGIVSVA